MGKFKQPIHSRRSLLSKRKEWRATGSLKDIGGFRKLIMGAVPVFFMAFVTAFVVASVFAPVQTSDAASTNVQTINANINSSSYYIKLWTNPTVNIDLMAGPNAPMSVTRTGVKTFTNSPSGFKLFLGMTSANTGLVLENGSATINSIGVLPSAATALGVNTWGYAIDGSSASGGTIPSPWAGTTHTVGTTMAANSEVFAGVPAYGSEQNGLVQSTNTANGTGSGDAEDEAAATNLGVYFGVRANSDMPSGRYTNTVAYTALAEASDTGDFSIMGFSPDAYQRPTRMEAMSMSVGQSTGTQLVIDTSVYTNMTDLGTATVTLKGGPLSTGNGTNDTQRTYTCANPVVESVANLVRVTCDMPLVYAGQYTVTVKLNKFDMTATKDYYSYVTWQTISAMQEMAYAPGSNATTKKSVCDLATDPAGETAGAKFYLPTSGNQRTDGLNAKANAAVWQKSAVKTPESVPEVYLKDLRDFSITPSAGTRQMGGYIQAGYYRIRKLADGNCWMTENMDHPQVKDHYYYKWDTDINSKEKWAPAYNYIDGTNPSDYTTGSDTESLLQYKDTNVQHDHTYFGNGCSNGWGTSGEGGSDVPCGTVAEGYLVKTYNNAETQKNGTYYTFQAATTGTGGAMSTANSNSPDTFCPAGWQLPYSGTAGDYYDASKSWSYLFTQYGYGDNQDGSNGLRSYPLDYVYSGIYLWNTGRLYFQGNVAYLWSSTIVSSTSAYSLHTWSTGVRPAVSDLKAYGFALRCVSRY